MRFREAVAAEFARRHRLNPRYSLRGFARVVGLHHATMSRLLRGSRPIPPRTISAIGTRLGMSDREIAAFTADENREAVVLAIGRSTFRPDSRWIASMANISIDSVNMCLQRLLRRGELRMPSRSQWVLIKGRSE